MKTTTMSGSQFREIKKETRINMIFNINRTRRILKQRFTNLNKPPVIRVPASELCND